MAESPEIISGSEVLLLEDDALLRKRLAAYLRSTGAEVVETTSLAEARRVTKTLSVDFALLDLHLPDGEALELLRENIFSENTGVVVMTAFGGIKQAVEAMRYGAGDYISKPFELEEVSLAFARCRQTWRSKRREEFQSVGATASSEDIFFGQALEKIRAQLDTVLVTERRLERRLPPVLIEGETGTGKSLLARWLFREGARAEKPFITVNCAALPESLAEAELFGHERGAFTDAKKARLGLLEAADGGTLFLDEIGSLSLGTQAKLLVALEEGKIRRLGGTRELFVDVRVIAASNQPLNDLVADGRFREDLFHRLNLLRVVLPPLRERSVDLLRLSQHLLATIARRYGRKGLVISPVGEKRLLSQPWRGNVRELAHELERAVIFSPISTLDFETLSGESESVVAPWRNPQWRLPESGFSLDQMVDDLIAETLRETDQNVSAAARRLGVTREFLRYRLSQQKLGETARE